MATAATVWKELDALLNDDLFSKLCQTNTTFPSFHSNGCDAGLVRGRFMIQNGGEPEYVNFLCTAKDGETIKNTTMMLRDGFDEELDIEAGNNELVVARHCYTIVEVPGVSNWFVKDFELQEVSSPKKLRRETQVQDSALVAKFYGIAAENLKPNSMLDVYGLWSEQHIQDNENEEKSGVKSLHVIKYDVITPDSLIADFTLSSQDMTCVRDVLKNNLIALLGDEASASFLLATLLSSTYARPNGMPICSIPLNITGVEDSEQIITFLKSVVPLVKVLHLTPQLLSDVPFASVKDYNTEKLIQGELQLPNGTLVIIDETRLPDGSFPVSGYVEANLKCLEQLILEQRIQYDFGFYKVPFDVDFPMIIISKKTSRILKTPFVVPYIRSIDRKDVSTLEDITGLCVARKYIQLVRKNLRHIGISTETTKMINDSFVQMAKSVPNNVDKADLLNELLILCRILAAAEGSDFVTEDHWKTSIKMEASRKEAIQHSANT